MCTPWRMHGLLELPAQLWAMGMGPATFQVVLCLQHCGPRLMSVTRCRSMSNNHMLQSLLNCNFEE